MINCVVKITKLAHQALRKSPIHIVTKLQYWVHAVENYGIQEVRKIPGFHDEPLKGNRKGQRSIRLNKSYRAIYEEENAGQEIQIIVIVEVNKHVY